MGEMTTYTTGSHCLDRQSCPWCSDEHTKVYHVGPCPRVKAIEYYPDGTIKRIEFHGLRPTVDRSLEKSLRDNADVWQALAGTDSATYEPGGQYSYTANEQVTV